MVVTTTTVTGFYRDIGNWYYSAAASMGGGHIHRYIYTRVLRERRRVIWHDEHTSLNRKSCHGHDERFRVSTPMCSLQYTYLLLLIRNSKSSAVILFWSYRLRSQNSVQGVAVYKMANIFLYHSNIDIRWFRSSCSTSASPLIALYTGKLLDSRYVLLYQ